MEIITKIADVIALWLEKNMGWSSEHSAVAGLAALVLLFLAFWGLKNRWAYWKNKKAATDLYPYFDYPKVKQTRELFIESRGQNLPPTHEEELRNSSAFIVKKTLIPWFMREAFDEKKERHKYYLILADSGMGKTTFMINLYIRYVSQWWGRKYQIKLLPFGDSRIIQHLQNLAQKPEEARNTILLLDAFDEYKGLLPPAEPDGLSHDERFRQKLDELVELTRDFREVVITSRTQYFPGQEDKPYELKIPTFDEKGFHTLAKLYLSPFDDREVDRYLRKKYGGPLHFWNRDKKMAAKNIVDAAPKLMVRPMLLAYIDYLVGSRQPLNSTYNIYDTLVQKWLSREADKRKHESTTREKFKTDLLQFSRKIAVMIYENQARQGNWSIDRESAIQLCRRENLQLEDYEITGQSLLTRDANHHWKFAHKSILEFLLAEKCLEDRSFALRFQFEGMDMARQFYEEKIFSKIKHVFEVDNLVRITGGTFNMNDEYPVSVSDFYMSKYPITQAEYVKITQKTNPSHFKNKGRHPVENVSWFGAAEFCNRLNELAGYPPIYDQEGRLLDASGHPTRDVRQVRGFRLPTEAEWEYAAGGGANNRTSFAGTNDGKELPKYAWFAQNSKDQTHPVGALRPNSLGLYDMSGNVWEWCTDWYHAAFYKKFKRVNMPENPVSAGSSSSRVSRGGSWGSNADYCRVAGRSHDSPGHRYYNLGFRVVSVP